jgi:hypothetical protein
LKTKCLLTSVSKLVWPTFVSMKRGSSGTYDCCIYWHMRQFVFSELTFIEEQSFPVLMWVKIFPSHFVMQLASAMHCFRNMWFRFSHLYVIVHDTQSSSNCTNVLYFQLVVSFCSMVGTIQ